MLPNSTTMGPLMPDRLRSPVLRAHGDMVARRSTEFFFVAWPELFDRYGERGRQRTFEDAYWHLTYLDQALYGAGGAKTFVDYARWLADLLKPRGMGDDIVCAAFVYLRELLLRIESSDDTTTAEVNRLVGIVEQAILSFPESARHPKVPE